MNTNTDEALQTAYGDSCDFRSSSLFYTFFGFLEEQQPVTGNLKTKIHLAPTRPDSGDGAFTK